MERLADPMEGGVLSAGAAVVMQLEELVEEQFVCQLLVADPVSKL